MQQNPKSPSSKTVEATFAISVRDISLGYGPTRVIEDFSLDFPAGAVTALVGPNGCGKSTLLKSLAGIMPLSGGTVEIDGLPLARHGAKTLARKVSFLPQVLPVPEGITVRQLVSYGRSPYNDIWGRLSADDADAVNSAIRQLEVSDLADRHVSDLSGGQRQRVWIAMIVAQQTQIVLLDEPTTFLDINHQVELLKFMQRVALQGKTVIVVLHDLNQAFRYADHVAVMKAGRLVTAGAPDMVATPDLLHDVFSIRASIIEDPECRAPMMVIKD